MVYLRGSAVVEEHGKHEARLSQSIISSVAGLCTSITLPELPGVGAIDPHLVWHNTSLAPRGLHRLISQRVSVLSTTRTLVTEKGNRSNGSVKSAKMAVVVYPKACSRPVYSK